MRDPSETTYLERYTPSAPKSHWDEGKKEEFSCSEETTWKEREEEDGAPRWTVP